MPRLGLSPAAGKLYIADTNNHAIRVVDLATGEVSTLALRGLAAPMAVAGFTGTNFEADEVIKVADTVLVRPDPTPAAA